MGAVVLAVVSVSCLADIPELTGGSSSSTSGASTSGTSTSGTSTTTSTTSTTSTASTGTGGATGWCNEEAPTVDFCADFDNVAMVEDGWDMPELGPSGSIELSTNHYSAPHSFYGSIEGPIGGTTCDGAKLRKVFVGDDPARRIRLEFRLSLDATLDSVVALVGWDRPAGECFVLARHHGDALLVSLQANPEGVEPYYVYAEGIPVFGEWGRFEFELDRMQHTVSAFQWNDTDYAPQLGTAQSLFDQWWDLCGGASSTTELALELGPHCFSASEGEITGAYYDDVTFDFLD